MGFDASIARLMAETLVDTGTDLGDERAVILTLKDAAFAGSLIYRLMDRAIDIARNMKAEATALRVA